MAAGVIKAQLFTAACKNSYRLEHFKREQYRVSECRSVLLFTTLQSQTTLPSYLSVDPGLSVDHEGEEPGRPRSLSLGRQWTASTAHLSSLGPSIVARHLSGPTQVVLPFV